MESDQVFKPDQASISKKRLELKVFKKSKDLIFRPN
jgi:hypothetical protein